LAPFKRWAGETLIQFPAQGGAALPLIGAVRVFREGGMMPAMVRRHAVKTAGASPESATALLPFTASPGQVDPGVMSARCCCQVA
jgi:hypothetical protein